MLDQIQAIYIHHDDELNVDMNLTNKYFFCLNYMRVIDYGSNCCWLSIYIIFDSHTQIFYWNISE